MAHKNVKWYGEDFKKKINAIYDKRVGAAGNVVRAEMKSLLSTSGRAVTTTTSKTGKVRRKLGKVGSAVSAPGDPPAKQTGRLRATVFKKIFRRKNMVLVGARGLVLDRGAPGIHLKPRPFVIRSLENVLGQVTTILTEPIQPTK
jgi:hypothetical protein